MENNKLALKSDFYDYYDTAFDRIGSDNCSIFIRNSTGGMNRLDMLTWLNKMNVKTVPYGTVKDIYDVFKERALVVYTDLSSHRGENKILLPATTAVMQYPNNLCSVYIHESEGKSIRRLQLGKHQFSMHYYSLDDWRSNCGSDVDIEIFRHDRDYDDNISLPMWAIDYVKHPTEGLLAVDFNISPGVRSTGIEDILTPAEVYETVKAKFFKVINGRLSYGSYFIDDDNMVVATNK